MTSLSEYLSRLPATDQDRIARRAQEIVAEQMRLGELRAAIGLSQREMAKRIGVGQPRISKIERKGDIQLSAMRSYVQALGGTLEVVATFPGGQQVRISTLADMEQLEATAPL